MSVTNPRDVPDAHAIIRRLCALQAHVVTEVVGHDHPADCFCGDEGYWPYDDPDDFRNSGKAVDFIVEATLAAISPPCTCPEPYGQDRFPHLSRCPAPRQKLRVM